MPSDQCFAASPTSTWGDFVVPNNASSIFLVAACIWLLLSKALNDWHILYQIKLLFEYLFVPVPLMEVSMTPAELMDDGVTTESSKTPIRTLKDRKRPAFIQCYDPSTRQSLGEVPAMTPSDVHDLCVRAAQAQKEWCQTTFTQRRQVLRTIQKYLVHHVQDICRVSSRDSGKPKVDALLGEVLTTCEKIRTINAWGELWLRPDYRPTGPLMVHKTAYVEYVPLGVVAPIAPWNYPFHNFMNHIISGIFAGNAVVGKVSEYTSWSSANYFTRIVQQALMEHGHNPDLCQTVTGYGEAGAALVSDPLVDKIIFTGSPAIGKKVMETASHHLKPVILELGGKDALVIMEDCKVEDVIPWIMRGCFQNCGQNCVGIERVLVYESIHDELVHVVTGKIKALRQGVPLEVCGSTADIDCGSMVTEFQCDLIEELVQDAVKKGATLVTGGKRNEKLPNGQFFEPTLLTGVTPDMRIFHEEVFGPVMTIVKVPKDDDNECLRLVNTSKFGLSSSVYCGNQARGLALGRRIRSGMMCINDFGSNYLVQSLPFGGVNDSGFGRFAGIEGLRAMCLERSIVVDRIPGVRTTIPPPINYPIDKKKGLPFAESLIHLFYDESIFGKIAAIFGLIKYG